MERLLIYMDGRKPGQFERQRFQIELVKAELLDQAGKAKQARDAWRATRRNTRLRRDLYTVETNFAPMEFDDLYGRNGRELVNRAKGSLINFKLEGAEWAFLEVMNYLWSRGSASQAEALLDWAMDRYPRRLGYLVLLQKSLMLLADGEQEQATVLLETLVGSRGGATRTDRLETAILHKLKDPVDMSLVRGNWGSNPGLNDGLGVLATAAVLKLQGEYRKSGEQLEMIMGAYYPWEPTRRLAAGWLRDLKAKQPQAFVEAAGN